MIFSKGLTRFGLVAAVAALMLTLSVAVAGTANTQMLPATFYGKGLKVGDKVEVSIGGAVCGIATATVAGEWSLQVAADNTCKPTINAAVVLKLNGVVVNAVPVAVWASGGLPSDVANGYVLSAVTVATAIPPKTGNAGLLGGSPGISATVVVLVVLGAVALVMGARGMSQGRGR